jgi:ABC-type amino acid transport substrate-binding protein
MKTVTESAFCYAKSNITGNYYIYSRHGENYYSTAFSGYSTQEGVNDAIEYLIKNGCYGSYSNEGFNTNIYVSLL